MIVQTNDITEINPKFNTGSVIFIKNIGTVPKKSPIVVSPNAKPGFDFNTDMAEFSHLNESGSMKVSRYFGQILSERLGN